MYSTNTLANTDSTSSIIVKRFSRATIPGFLISDKQLVKAKL